MLLDAHPRPVDEELSAEVERIKRRRLHAVRRYVFVAQKKAPEAVQERRVVVASPRGGHAIAARLEWPAITLLLVLEPIEANRDRLESVLDFGELARIALEIMPELALFPAVQGHHEERARLGLDRRFERRHVQEWRAERDDMLEAARLPAFTRVALRPNEEWVGARQEDIVAHRAEVVVPPVLDEPRNGRTVGHAGVAVQYPSMTVVAVASKHDGLRRTSGQRRYPGRGARATQEGDSARCRSSCSRRGIVVQSAAMILPDDDVTRFWRDGYLLIRGVFSGAEIESMRARIEEILREEGGREAGDVKVGALDLMSYPGLRDWLCDERVVSIVRGILGEEPVYFGDSSFQTGRGARGWHKDNRVVDRFDHRGLDWEGKYPLIRIGIYLQDHTHHSGGLGIRVGSHQPFWPARLSLPHKIRRQITLLHGRPIHVGTQPGDLAVWTLRTTHTGNSVRLKLLPWLKLPTQLEDKVPDWLAVPDDKKRAAMFATFAAKSAHLDRYIDYLKTRDYMREMWKNARITDEVRAVTRQKGLDVMKVEA